MIFTNFGHFHGQRNAILPSLAALVQIDNKRIVIYLNK